MTLKVHYYYFTENCRPPSSVSGYFIADKIRRIASPFGAIILFKAYLELNSDFLSGRSYVLQSELQSSGISLTHTPHNGRKDVADKMMIGAISPCCVTSSELNVMFQSFQSICWRSPLTIALRQHSFS